MKRKFTAIILLIITINTAHGQTDDADRQAKAKIDTRKGYDLRGYGFDSTSKFIARYHKGIPVIIAVSTEDKMFIDKVKSIIRNMDKQGYEHLTLILYDPMKSSLANGETHSILFFSSGRLTVGIEKLKGEWAYVGISNDRKLSGIILEEDEPEYPLNLIRTQIRTIHKQADGLNYVSRISP